MPGKPKAPALEALAHQVPKPAAMRTADKVMAAVKHELLRNMEINRLAEQAGRESIMRAVLDLHNDFAGFRNLWEKRTARLEKRVGRVERQVRRLRDAK